MEVFDLIGSRPDECTRLATVGGKVVLSGPELARRVQTCRRVFSRGEHQSMLPQQIIFLSLLGLFAMIGYIILINPYLWLLRASVVIPTKRMHRGDCYALRDSIRVP